MKRNAFVIALEDKQTRAMQTLRERKDLEIHGLLDVSTAVESDNVSFNHLLSLANEQLTAYPGTVDAIIAQWDFPTSVIVPILCQQHHLPSPSITSVLKCEHKYWSRLEQQKVVPDVVPKFCGIDPFAEDPLSQVTLDYPFWLKPVKAFSSHLGFKIESSLHFEQAIKEIRAGIRQLGDAFNEALAYIDVPEEIVHLDGNACIAEEIISGVQGAPEGSVFNGEFNIHGIISQPRAENSIALFDRLEYPSNLPEHVHHKMVETAKTFLAHIGYNNGCFNVEFMWDEAREKLWLIEVNTRISQSHSEIFVLVDGMSNHEIAVDIALGQRPSLLNRQGVAPIAAKCFIPFAHRDGVVKRIPSQAEIAALKARLPHTDVVIDVEPGQQLSHLMHQDSFCYRLGTLYVTGNTHEEIEQNYQYCLDVLNFDIEPIDA
ncbi:ATP-grasp domain-containing protein [Halomonas meridiana]|uniref:ATP-grasp domain-containing protein n=1 Tax=Vreelandella aquamarina TaxID=77097 RepID=UPI00273A773F|nr:ATP-grasp domain-containing protein [Halomonas meridiana]MDP4557070.1 ATP-grasp domain-containing protein [Halomonas meridiana]